MTEAIILIKKGDPAEKPVLYACPKCGQAHSPKIYACREEEAHEAARRAAEDCYNCRTHNECQSCGKETPKGWLKCSECREQGKLQKATVVEPSELSYCFGADGEYYHSPEEAAEAGNSYAFDSKFTPYSLNFDNVVESILDDHHEDASESDLIGIDFLKATVQVFNKVQKHGSYFEDATRVAYLPKAEVEE